MVIQSLKIISTKPYRYWLFISVVKTLFGGAFWTIKGPLGTFRLFTKVKNWLKNGGWVFTPFLFKQFLSLFSYKLTGVLFGWSVAFEMIGYYFRARKLLLPRRRKLKKKRLLAKVNWLFWKKYLFCSLLKLPLRFLNLYAKTYKMRLKFNKYKKRLRRIKRKFIWLHFGFFYDVVIFLPRSVFVYWRNRFFTLVGSDLESLVGVVSYIRFTRNLFPYKRKGFAVRFEKVALKPGKKVKYR